MSTGLQILGALPLQHMHLLLRWLFSVQRKCNSSARITPLSLLMRTTCLRLSEALVCSELHRLNCAPPLHDVMREVHLILCAFAMIGDWRDTMSRLAGPNLKSAGRPSSSSR